MSTVQTCKNGLTLLGDLRGEMAILLDPLWVELSASITEMVRGGVSGVLWVRTRPAEHNKYQRTRHQLHNKYQRTRHQPSNKYQRTRHQPSNKYQRTRYTTSIREPDTSYTIRNYQELFTTAPSTHLWLVLNHLKLIEYHIEKIRSSRSLDIVVKWSELKCHDDDDSTLIHSSIRLSFVLVYGHKI